jgi:hypothetical protein
MGGRARRLTRNGNLIKKFIGKDDWGAFTGASETEELDDLPPIRFPEVSPDV